MTRRSHRAGWWRRWPVLPRLIDHIYFGAGLYRVHVRPQAALRQPTRYECLRSQYGPSRRLIVTLYVLWFVFALGLVHLIIHLKCGI
jgi:hypothetical protein